MIEVTGELMKLQDESFTGRDGELVSYTRATLFDADEAVLHEVSAFKNAARLKAALAGVKERQVVKLPVSVSKTGRLTYAAE